MVMEGLSFSLIILVLNQLFIYFDDSGALCPDGSGIVPFLGVVCEVPCKHQTDVKEGSRFKVQRLKSNSCLL